MVEGAGLENRYTLFGYRGFESHPLRTLSSWVLRQRRISLWRRIPLSPQKRGPNLLIRAFLFSAPPLFVILWRRCAVLQAQQLRRALPDGENEHLIELILRDCRRFHAIGRNDLRYRVRMSNNKQPLSAAASQ